MNLNAREIAAMVAAMKDADFGEEIEIEIVDEDYDDIADNELYVDDSRDLYDEIYEDDGQPDEYTEWQDVYGGDDWDHGQYDE